MTTPAVPLDLRAEPSSWYVYAVATVAALAGLLFGFDTAVINGALILLRDEFRLTPAQTETAASSLLFGCVIGAAMAGALSDRFGRRRVLMLAALLFGVSAVWSALPRTFTAFVGARILGGAGIGVASLIVPLYIAEIAPATIRGRLVSLNQLAIVSGILGAYVVNTAFAGGADGWRWMFASAAVPSVLLLAGLMFVPESPRWLASRGLDAAALVVLERTSGRRQAGMELADIRAAIDTERGSVRDLLAPMLRRPLAIAIALAVLQQITGINTVLYYGSVIFKDLVGTTTAAAVAVNVAVGAINLIATIVALAIIDRVGRRPLLMFASAGMAAALLGLGAAFMAAPRPHVVLALILVYVACFAVGLGPGVWVVLAELFPTQVRGRAMSVATLALWTACLGVAFTFLSLVRLAGATGAFWMYAATSLVTFAVVHRFVPETKGRTLEEIEALWRR